MVEPRRPRSGSHRAPPPPSPEHLARVRALPLGKLRERLIAYACVRGAVTQAEDLANSAIVRLFTHGERDWDHVKDPTARFFLRDRLRADRNGEAKKASRQRTDADTVAVEEAPPSSDPRPDRTLLDRERAAWACDELLRRVADSPLSVRIVKLCMETGALEPREAAERLGEDIVRVYRCQRYIKAAVLAIQAELVASKGSTKAER